MRRLIELISDINFWSIVGVILSIIALYFTISQHRDLDIVFSLNGKENLEIEDNKQITLILLSSDKIAETCRRVRIPAPFGFYNPNKKALDIEYSIKSNGIECSMDSGEFKSLTVIRDYGNLLNIYFTIPVEQLVLNKVIKSDIAVMWNYENMTDRHNAFFKIQCIADLDQYESLYSKDDYSVVYILDSENSTSDEALFKRMI